MAVEPLQNLDLDAIGLGRKDAPAKKNDDLGEADFLRLLTAQLEHQNPLEPQDNGEFVSQMAQFGVLEGVNSLNTNFDTLAESMTSSQALEASSMVGRQVVIPAESAFYQAGEGFFGTMELPQSVSDVVLTIKDDKGALVRRDTLGPQKKGDIPFLWDGFNNSQEEMPSGFYTIEAEATIDGERTAITTNLTFNVDSVTLNKGDKGITLNLAGHDPVEMDDVKEIR